VDGRYQPSLPRSIVNKFQCISCSEGKHRVFCGNDEERGYRKRWQHDARITCETSGEFVFMESFDKLSTSKFISMLAVRTLYRYKT